MKKLLVIVSLVYFNISIFAIGGLLDDSFGTNGLLTTNFGGTSSDEAQAAILQPDGKKVVGGFSNVSGTTDFALARYNSDGSLDDSFGTNGRVTTRFGSSIDTISAVVLQRDGKIVAVGRSADSFALARYNADGSLDTSFGTNGLVTTSFGGIDSQQALAAILQPDGKIVAVGRSIVFVSGSDFILVRYNPDGTLDNSFGTGGLVISNFGGDNEFAQAVVLQPDSKIVVAGQSDAAGIQDFAVARYNADGSLDSSFGTNGLVTTDFDGDSDQGNAAILQPDGKIVIVGTTVVSGSSDFALARYNPDGTLDNSFGTGGLVITSLGGIDIARAAILQPDGKIVIVGRSNVSGNNDFAIARYNPDGTLDSSFGTNGLVTTHFGGSSSDRGEAALIQPNGKIVAIGSSNASGTNDFALARYLIPSVTVSPLARDLRAKYFLLQ